MNNGGGDGTSCFKIKIRTDAVKLTNGRITRFRQCRDLVRESEMFIEDKAKIVCRVSGTNRSVLYFTFSELLSVTNEEKFRFYPNVTTLRSGLCYRNSVCRLSSVCLSSVVCNVGAPYSGG